MVEIFSNVFYMIFSVVEEFLVLFFSPTSPLSLLGIPVAYLCLGFAVVVIILKFLFAN